MFNFYDACIRLEFESQIENLLPNFFEKFNVLCADTAGIVLVFNFSKTEWLVVAEFSASVCTHEKCHDLYR